MLGSRSHWVRQLPGQLLHNLISHGIAKLAEFLDEDIVDVIDAAGGLAPGADPNRFVNADNSKTDNAWHHVAGVINGTAAFLYLDGVQIATGTVNPLLADGTPVPCEFDWWAYLPPDAVA